MQMPPCLHSTFKIKYLLIQNWWRDCKKGSIIVETFFKSHYSVRHLDVMGFSLGAQPYQHCPPKKTKNPPQKAWESLCDSVLWFYSLSHTSLLSGQSMSRLSLSASSIGQAAVVEALVASPVSYRWGCRLADTPGGPLGTLRLGTLINNLAVLRFITQIHALTQEAWGGFTLMFTNKSLKVFNKYCKWGRKEE